MRAVLFSGIEICFSHLVMTDTSLVVPTRKQLLQGFLKIGLIGFGGVLPHARRMLVEDRRWLTNSEFTDLLGLGQCLPGPNIVNVSIVVGQRFHGWQGSCLAVAGLMFAPLVIVLSLVSVYAQFADSVVLQHVLEGIAAAAAGLMLSMGLKILDTMQKRTWSLAIMLAALLAIVWLHLPLLGVLGVLAPISIACGWFSVRRELAK